MLVKIVEKIEMRHGAFECLAVPLFASPHYGVLHHHLRTTAAGEHCTA
jgi:hypothetical protein